MTVLARSASIFARRVFVSDSRSERADPPAFICCAAGRQVLERTQSQDQLSSLTASTASFWMTGAKLIAGMLGLLVAADCNRKVTSTDLRAFWVLGRPNHPRARLTDIAPA